MFTRKLVRVALCSASVSLVASMAQAAPSAPGNVMVPPVATASTGTTIIWSKPSSYSTVASYNVYKNGTLLGNTTKLFYSVTGLSPSTSYSFYVRAKDTSGVESSNSNTINVSTPFAEYGDAVTLMTVGAACVATVIWLLFDDSTPLVSFERTKNVYDVLAERPVGE